MDPKDNILPKALQVCESDSPTIVQKADSTINAPESLENGINTLETSTDQIDSAINMNGKMVVSGFLGNGLNYRDCSDDSEDDSSSESCSGYIESSSSSSISSENDDVLVELPIKKKVFMTKTKGELTMEDLPKVEKLTISVPESELKAIGKVSAMVETVLVIESFKNSPALNMDSVLFLSNGTAIGKVFETFGPVIEPFYIVRFNSTAELKSKDFAKDDTVYYAPKNKDVTSYIFVDELRAQKGSDASWTDNNEPPVECLDYSDDEQEREARHKRRAKTRTVPLDDEIPEKIVAVTESAKEGFQNNMQSQSNQIPNNSFQKQQPNFRNPVFTFPGNFIGDVEFRAVSPANLVYSPNTHIRQPGQFPMFSPRPVILRPSQFLVPSRPRMNEWSTSEIRPQAVTLHQSNHQRPSSVNISVQNTFINSGNRQFPSNLASQSNRSGVCVKPSNSTAHSSFSTLTSTSGHRRQNSPQVSSISLHQNSSVMVPRNPFLCNPGALYSPPSMYSTISSPNLKRPSNCSVSTVQTENYKGTPFGKQKKMASKLVSGIPLLQSNLNTYNTSVPPVPFHQSSRITSPTLLNAENLTGNQCAVSNETLPSPISNMPFIPNQFSSSVPSYNHSRTSVFPSTTSNDRADALRLPSNTSSVISSAPTFSTSVPPPLMTWPPIQQPVFGMLPNNISRNICGMSLPIHTLPPLSGTIVPTNMVAPSSVLSGIIHTPPPPRFLLSPPNMPFFDPSVPPPVRNSP